MVILDGQKGRSRIANSKIAGVLGQASHALAAGVCRQAIQAWISRALQDTMLY